ncbi:hypothetical protein Patl1_07527 [Pistacia atlantica]|uniref:Uncharacterized protein n=1 Tax=Pistacia atlantica TaxID=434234 RepID=A0ACC1AH91_9ROSI|nr:hypothetical protein Patl1_07527 [Pistacia atlantica]
MICNNSRMAEFDGLGYFISTDEAWFRATDFGVVLKRRLTLDFDGNIRMYSLDEAKGTWNVSWQALSQQCTIHGICGPNSLCSYVPKSSRICSCLPGFKIKNPIDWSYGCEPEFEINCNNTEVPFLQLPNVDFFGYDILYMPNLTFCQFKNVCLQSCICKAFMHKFNIEKNVFDRYPKFLLFNGYRSPSFRGITHLKVPKAGNVFSNKDNSPIMSMLNCSGVSGSSEIHRIYMKAKENEKLRFLVWFTELQKATLGFTEKIGRGAGGVVYKGLLSDGRVAAIKRLKEANQGEAEFLAEVSTIGRLNHMNLIEMWGYCAEGRHRLLVYEYLMHGSLAENLSSKALKCDQLLPTEMADFGLSKLLNRGGLNNSSFSRIRGTRGYMAPEWVYNLPITSKVDVYGYGILLLEMVTGKSPIATFQTVDFERGGRTWDTGDMG